MLFKLWPPFPISFHMVTPCEAFPLLTLSPLPPFLICSPLSFSYVHHLPIAYIWNNLPRKLYSSVHPLEVPTSNHLQRANFLPPTKSSLNLFHNPPQNKNFPSKYFKIKYQTSMDLKEDPNNRSKAIQPNTNSKHSFPNWSWAWNQIKIKGHEF